MARTPSKTREIGKSGVLRVLRDHKTVFARRFGVVEMALYGSFARDEGGPGSDVDVLVWFDEPPDWKRYFGAQAYLEDLLGLPVDMATRHELRDAIRPHVEREAVDV